VLAQYVDPAVSRRKFERELANFRALGDEYRQRGWLLVNAEFPKVTVALAAPKLNPVPIVMGVRFDYTNYDALPPSVQLVNVFTGEPYKAKDLPSTLNRSVPVPQQEIQVPGLPGGFAKMMVAAAQPLMQAYGPDEIPFLCLAGVREYHQHPAHSGDLWELHRSSGTGRLVRLLDVIYRYGVEPVTGFGVQLEPRVGFNFGPPPL
jgi:hypothetical protein